MPTLSQECVDMGSAQLQLLVGFIARRSMVPSSQKSYCIDLFTLIFLAITCFAEDASATDIESMLSSRSESRVTMGTLNECKLVIEASYPQNINAEGHKPDGVRKAVKTVWIIDLSTVGSVKVAPVHGDMHVGFWPPRRTWVSKLLGVQTKSATLKQYTTATAMPACRAGTYLPVSSFQRLPSPIWQRC